MATTVGAGPGVTSVRPYWELTFDADGDPDPGQRDALLSGARELTDLVVFSHGWNNDVSTADALYDRFFAPFPALLPDTTAGLFGYAGVHWPSMRFSDEPIPDFPRPPAGLRADPPAHAGDPGGLDAATRHALLRVFPAGSHEVHGISELLANRPQDPRAVAEFVMLVERLTGAPAAAPAAGGGHGLCPDDLLSSPADGAPGLLAGDPVAVCAMWAHALAGAGCPFPPDGEQAGGEALFGGLGSRIWDGAKEVLRQATYWAMRRRSGTVGETGLGPALGALAARAPGVRVHLVGHSFGARLVSFALRGLPPGVRVASVTLLQGAFSHYAFSGPLPFDAAGGALHGMQGRVTGPLLACWSTHDTALSVFYPLASRVAGEDESLLGLGERWGALGHDGFQSLPGTPELPLATALSGAALPAHGCASVDASAVVCHGGPPSGAHSDICHPELARLVLLAAGQRPS